MFKVFKNEELIEVSKLEAESMEDLRCSTAQIREICRLMYDTEYHDEILIHIMAEGAQMFQYRLTSIYAMRLIERMLRKLPVRFVHFGTQEWYSYMAQNK